MLSAGLAVESAHRGLGGGLPGSLGGGLGGGLGGSLGGLGPPHHPMLQAFAGGEFLRPLPVPHRPVEPGPGTAMFSPPDLRFWLHHQQQQQLARFSGQPVSHHRMAGSATPTSQAPPPAPSPAPVNLSAPHKDEKDHLPPPPAPPPGPPLSFHYSPYPMPTPMFPAPYSPYAARPPHPSDAPAAYSPPAGSPAPPPPPPKPATKTFKVPSGKEGSLKHRILTHPRPSSRHTATVTALPTPVPSPSSDGHLHPASHPASPHHLAATAAPTLPHFWKGSLIRLESGEIRRVEDLRAEDFVAAAERNPTLKADAATVVRIHTLPGTHRVSIGLRLGGHQFDVETTSEHPFFVNGQGWASSSPERSMQLLGLSCKPLLVGEVCMSLTHRQAATPAAPAPAVPQAPSAATAAHTPAPRPQPRKQTKRPAAAPAAAAGSEPSSSNKKRRWSAPDQLSAEEAQAQAQAQAAAHRLGAGLARVVE